MAEMPLEKTEMSVTLDELMALGSDARVEVIDGEFVAISPVGGLHHLIGGNIYRPLDGHVETHELGSVFFDGLIYLMGEKTKRLKHSFVPDVSFVRGEVIPKTWNINKPYPGVPTLAVEIVSSDDNAEELLLKVRTYLAKGTEQVWVVYPESRELHQYRQSAGPELLRIYKGSEKIDLDDLFPGLELTMEMIFKLPKWAQR